MATWNDFTGNALLLRETLNPAGFFMGVGPNEDGRLEIVCPGDNGYLWHTWEHTPGGRDWEKIWLSLNLAGRPVMGLSHDGRIEVFVGGPKVYHIGQVAPNNGWAQNASSLGQPLNVPLYGDPAVGNNKDGRLEVFAAGSDGAVWHTWQESPTKWVGYWASRGIASPGLTLTDPAVGRNADGRLEVFAAGSDGAIWHTWQVAANNGWVGHWASRATPQAGVTLRNPAVASNKDGRLELIALGSDNNVWHTWQVAANNGWVGHWVSRGGIGQPYGILHIGTNLDGRLEVFLWTNSGLWHTYQTAPDNGWLAAPGKLLDPCASNSDPVVARFADGTLAVFIDLQGTASYAQQAAPNSTNWL